jgi:hypothetical protein
MALAFVVLLASCGAEDCLSVGPFGDCGDKAAVKGRPGVGAPAAGGELRAWTEGQPREKGRIEIITAGGVPPYTYRVSGRGEMQDANGIPNERGRFYFAKDAVPSDSDPVVIRVTDASPERREIFVPLLIQR